jgi:hypothetical protein
MLHLEPTSKVVGQNTNIWLGGTGLRVAQLFTPCADPPCIVPAGCRSADDGRVGPIDRSGTKVNTSTILWRVKGVCTPPLKKKNLKIFAEPSSEGQLFLPEIWVKVRYWAKNFSLRWSSGRYWTIRNFKPQRNAPTSLKGFLSIFGIVFHFLNFLAF